MLDLAAGGELLGFLKRVCFAIPPRERVVLTIEIDDYFR